MNPLLASPKWKPGSLLWFCSIITKICAKLSLWLPSTSLWVFSIPRKYLLKPKWVWKVIRVQATLVLRVINNIKRKFSTFSRAGWNRNLNFTEKAWKNYSKPFNKKVYLLLNWNPLYFINKFGQNVIVKKKKREHTHKASDLHISYLYEMQYSRFILILLWTSLFKTVCC